MNPDSVAQVPERPLYPDQAKALRKALTRHNVAVERAHKRLAEDLRAMIEAGAEVKAIATAAGVSRQTIYEWLKRDQPDP